MTAECDCPPDACLCRFAERFNSSQQRLRDDSDRLADVREAIHRLNVDWATVRHECGDPKCGGDCQWVRLLERALGLDLSR